jgi:hypothetical protein
LIGSVRVAREGDDGASVLRVDGLHSSARFAGPMIVGW